MPAGTVAQWLWKTWWKWTQAPAPSQWPQAQHAQDFMDSVIITLAKLGSRGRQSKVSTVVAAGAPSLGVQPQEIPGSCQAGAHKHQQHPTSVHRDAQGDGSTGEERYSPCLQTPKTPQQWQCFPASLSHSPCAQHEMGTGRSSAALLVPAPHEGWVGFSLEGMPCHHCSGS